MIKNCVKISLHVKGDLKINEPLNFNSKCDLNLAVKLYLGVTRRERGADSTSEEVPFSSHTATPGKDEPKKEVLMNHTDV